MPCNNQHVQRLFIYKEQKKNIRNSDNLQSLTTCFQPANGERCVSLSASSSFLSFFCLFVPRIPAQAETASHYSFACFVFCFSLAGIRVMLTGLPLAATTRNEREVRELFESYGPLASR